MILWRLRKKVKGEFAAIYADRFGKKYHAGCVILRESDKDKAVFGILHNGLCSFSVISVKL